MSLIEQKGHSQVVPSGFDDPALGQLEGMLGALTLSQRSVVADGEGTASDFRRFMAAMHERFAVLSEENRILQEQLVAQGSREREIIVLHHGELVAVRQEAETARREVIALRQALAESAQRAEARVSAEIAAKTEAVRAATQAGDARLAASQQEIATARQEIETMRQEHAQRMTAAMAEKNAAVQAATQRGDAQMAAALQQAEAIRQAEAERARKLAAETERQTKDTDKMQLWCQEVVDAFIPLVTHLRYIQPWENSFRAFINERRGRPVDLNTNVMQQRTDTQKLQQLDSKLLSIFAIFHPGNPVHALTGPTIQSVHAKMVALIAERNTR